VYRPSSSVPVPPSYKSFSQRWAIGTFWWAYSGNQTVDIRSNFRINRLSSLKRILGLCHCDRQSWLLASRELDVSNENALRGMARRVERSLLNVAWPTPREWPRLSEAQCSRHQLLLKFKRSKHHHTLLNGFDNETTIKVCNVDSKKKNSIGKTCCYQPSILLYPPSDGFRGQETGRYRRRPDGTEKLNVPPAEPY
jgi:hypothetical protein